MKWFILLTALASSLASLGCNGKDCSEPRPAAESEERFVERVEDYLDDAEADSDQTNKIVTLAKGLSPARQKMRTEFEPHRSEILKQMLADQPDVAVIDREVDGAADAMLGYADAVVDQAMSAHRILSPEQRKKLAKELREPPEAFEIGWKEEAAVDLFLLDIGATDAQKVLVRDHLVDVERDVVAVQNKQHGIRLAILPHIESSSPDPTAIKALVHKGGGYSVGMIQGLTRTYVKLMGYLKPPQRAKAKKRLSALRRCPAD